MSNFTLVSIMQLIGVVLIIAEFILPSGGMISVVAVGAFGYSLFHTFRYISTGAGLVLVAADALIIPVAVIIGIKLLARSPVTLRHALSSSAGVSSQDSALVKLVGKQGTALTTLRPAGAARIENKRYDVVSSGDFIDKDSPVAVCEVDGNRIVVCKIESEPNV